MRLYLIYRANVANLPKKSTNGGMIAQEGIHIGSFV